MNKHLSFKGVRRLLRDRKQATRRFDQPHSFPSHSHPVQSSHPFNTKCVCLEIPVADLERSEAVFPSS
ncbi:LOW QUALITY PROTEIN: hypothetical protein CH63R_07158 [Colletotrichum higginsianum IMI 349063]|uniref:Uncharacterized protein n=1 Tax=Colletotrichum higginsianum (strain IMI 349063) TaxID=759273 RepID=A0A1B7Y8J3_COLHI|nr:LOW QUALITY PROTEIN: hypothetical protein CH63R_07158 [Colletotrichum higginsianum IMI 349063]OBR08393.1 LOW QUALITY PROTEIN: hypothetical protein CH63R_07158 [Colletotrichum higginsianum IMI 349063]